MVLDFERVVTLITDLGELFDRYSFLALPGTAMKTIKKNSAANVRLGNYNMLRDICLGQIREMESLKWLQVFEAACAGADQTIKNVLDRLSHIPMRLQVDSEEGNSDEHYIWTITSIKINSIIRVGRHILLTILVRFVCFIVTDMENEDYIMIMFEDL